MTIGKVFVKGILDETTGMILESMDAISMLCLYGIVQGEDEFELMFPQELPEKNIGIRILRDMQSFQYFHQKNISSPEQVLELLYKKKVHYSIWRNRSWLRGMMPRAYVKGSFLYYPEKRKGKDVEVKVWLYSYKLLFARSKSYMESILDEIEIID